MEISFVIKCFVVISFSSVCNVEAMPSVPFDLLDFYRLNNSKTIVVEFESTWSSWFRNTYINNRSNPEYVAKFTEDNTLMFVVNVTITNECVMFLLDSDGKEVATIHLDDPPHYNIFVQRRRISLDAFEDRFQRNNFKSLDPHAEEFLIEFIDQKTHSLNDIEKLGKACTVRSPIPTMVWCDEPDDIETFSDYDIDFCIITSSTDEKKIKFYDLDGLLNSKYDLRLETVVLIHGYQIWPFTSGHDLIKLYQDAYFGDGTRRFNLIGIDWSGDMPIDYPRATYRVKDVGTAVGTFLSRAIEYNLMRPNDIYLVGHSLGAHVAGFAGKTMKSLSHNARPKIITAMDPARPLFRGEPCDERVCSFDADWVEILHSNADVFGLGEHYGDSDFYLNGGQIQPGCSYLNSVCHHKYAHQFHRKMITHGDRIDAWRCESLHQMVEEKQCVQPCNPRRYFGEAALKESGIFYVPYPAIEESDIPVESTKAMNITKTLTNTTVSNEKPKSIALLGVNSNNVKLLADLLTDDPNLYVRQERSFNVSNYGIQSNEMIMSHLNGIPKPIRFVLTVDYTDLFHEDFWTLLRFIAEDRTYHNELIVVAMNMPYVKGPLYYHVGEIKDIIRSSDTKKLLGAFQIRGLHEIKEGAKISQIPNLQQEMTAIRSIVNLIEDS